MTTNLPVMADQVAIVTGASSGIGEATAHRLQQTGFVTYAGARRLDRMAVLADQGVHIAELDVTDDGSMVALVDQVLADQGHIDVLVNNAGYGSYGAVEDVPLDEGRRQLEVNLFGLARMSQLVTPSMRAAGPAGSSTSPRWAATSARRWVRGTTPASSRWRGSATACGSSCTGSAST